jgi:hypothetical protein
MSVASSNHARSVTPPSPRPLKRLRCDLEAFRDDGFDTPGRLVLHKNVLEWSSQSGVTRKRVRLDSVMATERKVIRCDAVTMGALVLGLPRDKIHTFYVIGIDDAGPVREGFLTLCHAVDRVTRRPPSERSASR